MAYKDHTHFDLEPLNLGESEIARPEQLVGEFFSVYKSPYWDTYLTEWLRTAFSSHIWRRGEPCIVLHFHNNLIRLLEAAWLIQGGASCSNSLISKAAVDLFKASNLAIFRDNFSDMLSSSLSRNSIYKIGNPKSCTNTFVSIYSFLFLLAPLYEESGVLRS